MSNWSFTSAAWRGFQKESAKAAIPFPLKSVDLIYEKKKKKEKLN